jgi:hypothetical protein
VILKQDEVTSAIICYEKPDTLTDLQVARRPTQCSLAPIEVYTASVANSNGEGNFLSLRWRLLKRSRVSVSHADGKPSAYTFHDATDSNFEIEATNLSSQWCTAKEHCLVATTRASNIV